MKQISISQIQRNLHTLDDFDIIEVVDKKRHVTKGYFLHRKYVALVKELHEEIQDRERRASRVAGALHEFARPDEMVGEADAWRQHLVKRYRP